MRVLQLYRTYMPETQGGLEEAIRQICIATGKYGVAHRVLTMARTNRIRHLQRPEAEIIQVPLQMEPASCSMGAAMLRAYQQQAKWADVIQIHYPWPFADMVHLLSAAAKPVVLTYHADIVRQQVLEKLYCPLRTLFFRKVSAFVATSPNYARTSPVLRKLAHPPEIIPLGLSPESCRPPGRLALKTVHETYGRDFYLFVGVLRYYKGLYTLVEASAAAGLPVVIAGQGPERQGLKTRARQLGAANIGFAGFVSDEIKHALFQQCKAVVFPSCQRSEAFGYTLLEGQLHSKPLVTCEIGTGTSYVNQDGQTGFIVPPNDPKALASAMLRLENNPDLATRLGAAGRQRLEALFSGRQVGRRYVALYRKLCANQPAFSSTRR